MDSSAESKKKRRHKKFAQKMDILIENFSVLYFFKKYLVTLLLVDEQNELTQKLLIFKKCRPILTHVKITTNFSIFNLLSAQFSNENDN